MQRRVLSVWLPNWPCQRAIQSDQGLIKQPFALQARDARRGLIVAASSPLARHSGIHPGMSIAEARSLLPALNILEHDPQEDLEALCWLADAAQTFSPIVGLETLGKKLWSGRSLLEPQGLVLDATNLGVLFGGELTMAQQVLQWLSQQGLLGSVAIADSLGAAWALANYSTRDLLSEKLLVQHSEGAISTLPPTIVFGEETQTALAHLSVEALRLEREAVHSLRRLGIRTIGDLVSLPRAGLATRFGVSLIDRIDQAWMREEEPIASLQQEPEFAMEQAIEYPTDCRETIEEILRRLTLALSKRLYARGRGALRLVSRLDLIKQPSIVMQLGLYRPTSEVKQLTPLLLGQLDRQWTGIPGATPNKSLANNSSRRRLASRPSSLQIHRVTLTATLTSEHTWQQPDLFEVDQVVHRDSMAQLINNLSCRLGRRSVVAPQIHGDPQPELACSWRPLTGRRNDGKPQETHRKLNRRVAAAEPCVNEPLRRPLTLLQPPAPLDIIATISEGPPLRFRWNGKPLQVMRYWGAERIETGWWRGPSQRRDYYRIETNEGTWLWIFRNLVDDSWFLHGIFD